MASLCCICCDNNATVISSLCSNDKCMGNICRNCVSEVIKIKNDNNKIICDDNEKIICMYECPFCKTVNDNILPHICSLNKEEFNELIHKKVTDYNSKYREIIDDVIADYRQTIDNLNAQTQGLSYRLYNTEYLLKLQKEKTADKLHELFNIKHRLNLQEDITEDRENARQNLVRQLKCKQTTINNLQSEKEMLHEHLKIKKMINLDLHSENNSLSNENDQLKLKIKQLETEQKIKNLPKDKYYCRCCDTEMKKSSKHAHLKSKKHIKNTNN